MKRIFKNEMGFKVKVKNEGNHINIRVEYPFAIDGTIANNTSIWTIEDVISFKEELKKEIEKAREIREKIKEMEIYLKAYLQEQGFTEEGVVIED